MTIKAVLIAISVVHFIMLIGVFFTINDHPELGKLGKTKLFLLALILPILGPIYVNYTLNAKMFVNGRFISTSDYSGGFQGDSADSSGSSSSSDGCGGGG